MNPGGVESQLFFIKPRKITKKCLVSLIFQYSIPIGSKLREFKPKIFF